MAMAVLAKLANVAWHMGLRPQQSVALGQVTLSKKKVPASNISFPEISKNDKSCKMHRKISACRKNANDLSK
jgi:hypothetical protein